MGGFSPRPFFAAAALNGLNFLTGCFLAGVAQRRTPAVTPEALNPLASFRWPGHDRRRRPDGGLLHHELVGQVPAALWVIFGEDRFHWDATTIGISLAAFGILHSLPRQ